MRLFSTFSWRRRQRAENSFMAHLRGLGNELYQISDVGDVSDIFDFAYLSPTSHLRQQLLVCWKGIQLNVVHRALHSMSTIEIIRATKGNFSKQVDVLRVNKYKNSPGSAK